MNDVNERCYERIREMVERHERGEPRRPVVAAAEQQGEPAAMPGRPDLFGMEQRCRREWEASAALRQEFRDSFESFLAFSKAEAKGLVRVISKSKAQSGQLDRPSAAKGAA